MAGRIMRRAGFAGMVAVALVLAHDLVFLAAYGGAYQDALDRTGHDASWNTTVLVVLAVGVILLAAACRRLRSLGTLALALDRQAVPAIGRKGFLQRLRELWLRLAVFTTILFVLQENLEHQHAGEALPGLGVLISSEYPNALLIIGVVALAVALVGAVVRWRRDVLMARLSGTRTRWRTPSGTRARPSFAWLLAREGSLLGRRLAGRAPPAMEWRRGRSFAGSS
jgi:hypothetical protein